MSIRSITEKTDARRLTVALLPLIAGAVGGLVVLAFSSPIKMLAVFAVLVAIAFAVARIEWGLAGLVFISYSGLSDVLARFHGAPGVLWPFAAVLLVAIVVRWALFEERFAGWMRPGLLIFIYGLVCVASLMWAADGARTREALVEFAQGAIIAGIVLMLLQRIQTLHRVVYALLAAGILMGTISVYQYMTGTFGNEYGGYGQAEMRNIAGRMESHRITGPIGDSNFYAQIMLVLIPLALERTLRERRLHLRMIALWALVVTSLTVIFTFSRGAFIASAALLAVFVVRSRLRPAHVVLLAFLGFAAIPFLPDEYLNRMKTLVDVIPGVGGGIQSDSAFRGRASELAAGWMMFEDHPVTGVGFGNYPAYYQRYSQQLGLDSRLADRSAHSMYMQIAAETGLLGIATFGLLIWIMLRGMHRAARALRQLDDNQSASIVNAFYAGLIGYLTAGIFLHTAYARYFWLLAAVALAIPKIARKEVNTQTQLGEVYAEPSTNLR